MRKPSAAIALATTVAAIGTYAGTAGATATPNPCPRQPSYGWMGDSVTRSISIPSLGRPKGISSYRGTILRPEDRGRFAGRRPVVVLQHGRGGSQCGLWWAAQDLAGHGYVTLVWTAPDAPGRPLVNAIDATRSAIAFARSSASPYGGMSDRNRVVVGGHSLGSIVTSIVQGDPGSGIIAAVALDNLHRWRRGDPGAAVSSCAGRPTGEVIASVPALGFAKDSPCDARPSQDPPDLKLPGFLHWRDAGVPSMELAMRGFGHGDFATKGDERQHRELAHYLQAWLARWAMSDRDAMHRLLAGTVLGEPAAGLLSTRFRSAAFLPGTIDTTDYAGWLERHAKPPRTVKVSGPGKRVAKRRGHHRRIRFAFRSTQSHSRFECRRDGRRWAACAAPKRIAAGTPGRHVFRVRAIGPSGSVDPSPAKWRYRVVKRGRS